MYSPILATGKEHMDFGLFSRTGQPRRCHVVASQSSRGRQVWGQAMVQPERPHERLKGGKGQDT